MQNQLYQLHLMQMKNAQFHAPIQQELQYNRSVVQNALFNKQFEDQRKMQNGKAGFQSKWNSTKMSNSASNSHFTPTIPKVSS